MEQRMFVELVLIVLVSMALIYRGVAYTSCVKIIDIRRHPRLRRNDKNRTIAAFLQRIVAYG